VKKKGYKTNFFFLFLSFTNYSHQKKKNCLDKTENIFVLQCVWAHGAAGVRERVCSNDLCVPKYQTNHDKEFLISQKFNDVTSINT
jgi:hypothetical protein